MINETKHFEKRWRKPDIHENWELEGISMSRDGISIFNILMDPGRVRFMGKNFSNHSATAALGGGKFVFVVGHPWSGQHDAIQHTQRAAFDVLSPEVDIFDAFAFTFPRIYHSTCDGSHVSCVLPGRLTALAYWELLILAQLLL